LVRGASGLAARFGISSLAIGLTVVAFGTSAPELLVSLDAAFSGANDISVGNVVGSNIANIALILGLAAMFRPIAVHSRLLRVDIPIMIFVSLALLAVIAGGGVTRLEGLMLATGLAAYVYLTLRHARAEAGLAEQPSVPSPAGAAPKVVKSVVWVVLGLSLLFLGAQLLVAAAGDRATVLPDSQAAIGRTVVAVGTSLPELATTIVACIKRHGDIAIGNVIGSNIFNILGVLGVTALFHPLEAGEISWLDLGLMAGLAGLLGIVLFNRLTLNRKHGVIFLVVFVAYTVWTLS
jgi:cation:H+ antiporter